MDNFDIEPGNGSPKKSRKGLNTVLWGVGSFALAVAIFFLIVTFFFPKAGTVNVTTPTSVPGPTATKVVEREKPSATAEPAAEAGSSTAACQSFLSAMKETNVAGIAKYIDQALTQTTDATLLGHFNAMKTAFAEQNGDPSGPMGEIIITCIDQGGFTPEEYAQAVPAN